MDELGCRPSRVARALVTGRTRTIALFAPNAEAAHYVHVAQHLREYLRQDDYDVMVGRIMDYIEPVGNSFSPPEWPVDGLFLADCAVSVGNSMQFGLAESMNIVTMGIHYMESTDYVAVDLLPVAREVLQHLISPGRRRVALMLYENAISHDPRRQAYAEVMAEAGLEPELIVLPGLTRSFARSGIRQYVTDHGCPEAIFCYNDEGAIGAYRGLHDLGIRIGDDVALVGCDGIEDTEYFDTPISTIVMPVEKMCETAWEFLSGRINDPSRSLQRAVVTPRFVARESSRTD